MQGSAVLSYAESSIVAQLHALASASSGPEALAAVLQAAEYFAAGAAVAYTGPYTQRMINRMHHDLQRQLAQEQAQRDADEQHQRLLARAQRTQTMQQVQRAARSRLVTQEAAAARQARQGGAGAAGADADQLSGPAIPLFPVTPASVEYFLHTDVLKANAVRWGALLGRDGTVWGTSKGVVVSPEEAVQVAKAMEVGCDGDLYQERVYLHYQGTKLTDQQALLCDLGVCSEAMLEIGPDAYMAKGAAELDEGAGGMMVFVTGLDGSERVSVEVGPDATVGDLAQAASIRLGDSDWMEHQRKRPGVRYFASDYQNDPRPNGVTLRGQRYFCLRYCPDENVIYGRYKHTGVCVCRTERVILVGGYDAGQGDMPGDCNMRMEHARDNLKERGL